MGKTLYSCRLPPIPVFLMLSSFELITFRVQKLHSSRRPDQAAQQIHHATKLDRRAVPATPLRCRNGAAVESIGESVLLPLGPAYYSSTSCTRPDDFQLMDIVSFSTRFNWSMFQWIN